MSMIPLPLKMRILRLQMVIGGGIVVLFLMVAFLTSRFEKLIIYNPTPSVETGFYIYKNHEYGTSSIILFKTPSVVKKYTQVYYSKAPLDYFLKPVLAGEGDHVCYQNGAFYLNGKVFAKAEKKDSSGHPLPLWQECRALKEDEVFVFSDRVKNSFDSRYYGPVLKQNVIGSFTHI